MKLVRYLQQNAGLSRRKASEMIMSRKVTVDGDVIDQISFLVDQKHKVTLN